MTPAPSQATRAGNVVLLAATLAGALLVGVATSLYPGGTVFEPAGRPSFWLNFLCDLTADVALNGHSNPGARCAKLALLSFCVAQACFWWLLPQTLGAPPRPSRSIARWGSVSLMGLVCVPFSAGWGHVAAVLGGALPALVAASQAARATMHRFRSGVLTWIAWSTVAAASIDACLYVQSYLRSPREVVPALPVLQKLALFGIVVWMSAVALIGLAPISRRSA